MQTPLDPALARVRTILVVATAVELACTLVSFLLIVLSFMLFDAPGSEHNRYLLIIAWSVWLFPIACGVAIGSAWIGYARRWLTFARLVLLLPVANAVAFGVGAVWLEKYCGGRFAC